MPDETHYSADAHPITIGAKFWDNNMRVVQITGVAVDSNPYTDDGTVQTWHQTGAGMYDTLSGDSHPWGRLARFDPFTHRRDAEDYPAGTQYADVK
jgi:hypothetical protein